MFSPAIAAIALGLVGSAAYTYRTGRLAAFNNAGNVLSAAVFGVAGYLVSIRAGFWFAGIVSVVAMVAALRINPRLIDHDVARGLTAESEPGERQQRTGQRVGTGPPGFTVLLRSRALLALCTADLLWQLANRAMLPLTGQELAVRDVSEGVLYQAALIIVAQLVMIPISVTIAKRGPDWGRRTIFLIALARDADHRVDRAGVGWNPTAARCRAR